MTAATLPSSKRAVVSAPTVLDVRVVSGSGGGPDKTILNSPRFLEPLGYRMLCAYLAPPDDPGYAQIEQKADKYGAPLLTVPDRGRFDWRVLRHCLRICREENVSIWHGHDYKSNLLGLILRRFHRMRLVTTVHGWVEQTARTPLYYKIDKWCLPYYERVFCVSDDLVQECRGLGVKPEHLLLLENAIDTNEYHRRISPAAAKAKLGLPAGTRLIGAVGRLSEEKGFDLLLRAVQPLFAADPTLKLFIVGEGKARAALESLIRELSLREQVTLCGWRSDVRDLFEAMDLFVLSSRREGLPNVLLEAMALGVPIVATAVNGVPKLIRDGVDGRLVTSESTDELRLAIAGLLNDEAECRRLQHAGPRRIEESFSFSMRIAKLAAVYQELLESP